MNDRVKVTCHDPATGEDETQELDPDGYIVFCGKNMYFAHEMIYPKSGTIQLTIKRVGAQPAPAARTTRVQELDR